MQNTKFEMLPVFPIQFKYLGKKYRLQLQEDRTGDSCLGCVFDVNQNCNQPRPNLPFADQREAVEWGCVNHTEMIWKEIDSAI